MKKLSYLSIVLFSLFWTFSQSFALSISLLPSSQTISPGGTATVDLTISELGSGGPDSLGAFGLDIVYDDLVLGFSSVEFGPFLGDISSFEAVAFFDDSTPGLLYLDEVSFLFDFELDALQPASFSLATIMFTGIGLGFSALELENVVLSDAFGFELTDPSIQNASVNAVPEPATIMLIASGLAGLGVFGRRKLRHSKE